MVSWYDLELHPAFGRLSSLRDIPQADIIIRRATPSISLCRIWTVSRKTDHAMCFPSGNATTQETMPELAGFRIVFMRRGALVGPDRPSWRTSQTSIPPFLLPA